MSSTDTIPSGEAPQPQKGFLVRFFRQEFYYILLIILALIGVAYTDLSPKGSIWYWQLLTLIYGAMSILVNWNQPTGQIGSRSRLIWTQVLHWGAFLLAMRLALLPVMQENLTSDVTGLVLLQLLAISAFLAGIYVNFRFLVVAVFLAAGMLSIAFLDQASLLMLILAVVAVVGLSLWFRRGAQ